jgi:hypothetical protein
MKTTAENWRGRGEGKETIAEASAQFMSQYGVKPGGKRDSCRFWNSLSKWLSCVWIIHVHEGNLFWLCGAGKRVVLSVVHKQQIYLVKQAFNNITELHTKEQNSMVIVTIFFGSIYFKLLMYFTMNVCFSIGYWKLQLFLMLKVIVRAWCCVVQTRKAAKLFGLYLDHKVPCQNYLIFSFIQSHKHNIIPRYIRWPTDLYPKCLHIIK